MMEAACFAASVLALGFMLAPSSALAQFAFLDPPRGQLERTQELDLFVDGEFGGDFDAGGGFNRVHTGARFVTDGAVNRNFGLGATLAFAYDGYNFDESQSGLCGPTEACFQVSPWKSIYTVDIAPSASLILMQNFQVLVWVPMRFSLEPGNSENSFTGGIIGGARLVLAQGRIATTFGVGYTSDLEGSGRVFPVIGIDWQLGQRWRIVTEGGPYEGGLATILFGPSKDVKLRFSAGWERKRFRLSNAGDRHKNGVGEQRDAPILVGVDFSLTDNFRLEVHGGLSVAGQLLIYDSGGLRLSQTNYDVAGRFGGSFEIVF